MTVFGIYLVIASVIGIMANCYGAGQGGVEHGPGVLVFAAIWALMNTLGILFFGTGSLF